jgi:hypothetical protein
MGRKKNLQVLHSRRVYLKNKVAGMSDTDLTKDVFEDELEALGWALRKLEADEIGVGDLVKLYVYEDEESDQPEEGRVIGYAAGGYLIRPSSGKYSGTMTGLWYAKGHVTLVDP